MRKTKIICTLGPASSDEATLREMMKAGMDVARLNFSHGTYEEHRKKANMIKKLRQELNLHTALLLDTKGPEIRLGTFEGGRVTLRAGQRFSLYMQEHRGDENGVSVRLNAKSILRTSETSAQQPKRYGINSNCAIFSFPGIDFS